MFFFMVSIVETLDLNILGRPDGLVTVFFHAWLDYKTKKQIS